jgi:Uma2 family endonuclease
MSVSAPPRLMTTEELLAMPDDGVERWLIRGQLRENGMTVRNRSHSRVLIRVGQVLANWLDQQPEPRGAVLGGEAGVRLRRDPDTTVGVDVVYISPEVVAQQTDESTVIVGVPTLCVEILSPSDTIEAIDEKIDGYLAAGVPLVWVIDARHRTVEIFRPGEGPALVNDRQELAGDPHLPGFRVAVAKLFQ